MHARIARHAWTFAAVVASVGCKDATGSSGTVVPPNNSLPARTFRMGFSALPPKPTNESALATIDAWSKRADAAIMHISVPYKALLTGTTAATYVNTVDLPLANAAAADVRAVGGRLPLLYASVQADFAWGPPPAAYRGAETDFRDFPFNQVLAISSYPYFVYADPDQIPIDYYTRIAGGRALPTMVVEGGWTSASVGSIQSSTSKQARYLRRQERLLDSAKAIAVFQLSYTDFDISAYQPLPSGSLLPLFASVGFVDVDFKAKLALSTYDSILARPLKK